MNTMIEIHRNQQDKPLGVSESENGDTQDGYLLVKMIMTHGILECPVFLQNLTQTLLWWLMK